jgi:RNA polymerase sigma-70 factor (family 1)
LNLNNSTFVCGTHASFAAPRFFERRFAFFHRQACSGLKGRTIYALRFFMPEQLKHTALLLMTGFRKGDEACFSTIFNELYPALCFYGYKMTEDLAVSQDIAEESFLKVWEKRKQFEHWNALKSFLYTTVRNASIDWIRKQATASAALRSFPGAQQNEIAALENLIRAEFLREIYSSIERLPKQCRKIMQMIYVEGKSSGQVASVLNLSQSSIRNQKARGLSLLRKMVHLPIMIACVFYF